MSEHAIDNAKGWLISIREYAKLLRDWSEVEDARTAKEDYDPEDADSVAPTPEQLELIELASEYEDEDTLRERIYESPLSVQVRSGWHDPGTDQNAEEYMILLSTGGPALRITGNLDQYMQPESAKLEWQDWFTPWTDYPLDSEEESDVLIFAQEFWYGE